VIPIALVQTQLALIATVIVSHIVHVILAQHKTVPPKQNVNVNAKRAIATAAVIATVLTIVTVTAGPIRNVTVTVRRIGTVTV
jgi:hypothetical protein